MPHRVCPPDYLLKSIFDIPFQELWDNRITAIIFDVDNTLGKMGCNTLDGDTVDLLGHAKRRFGFTYCFGSNATRDMYSMAGQVNAFVVQARKPTPKKPHPDFFHTALKLLGTSPQATAMVGDKLLHDISPAANLGLTTVLVNPRGRDLLVEKLVARRHREKRALQRLGLERP